LRRRLSAADGQALLEFSLVLPMMMVMVLGVLEIGYALLDQHVVTKITREGSNLISRDTTIADAANALKNMKTRPVDFDNSSRMIFSVLKRGATTGTTNFDKVILYQRYAYGSLSSASQITTRGPGTFGAAPDYVAANADSDANLQVTNLPANIIVSTGGLVYVNEVFTTHTLLTPLDRFGITLPSTLYSIAYF
jgi:Flp pilus assembly protein TadG